jgi:hypothetical protein
MQDAADGTGSNGWQTASAQGSLQQAEGPGGTLISFTVWFATKLFQDALSLWTRVRRFAATPGGDAESRQSYSMKTSHQFADAVCFFETSLHSSLAKGLSVGQSQQGPGSPDGINTFAAGFGDSL